ncbi:MAG: response regulator [Leptospiraceae bacterium]|nr:response regulator [Leptospiraceae bacterium]
MYKVLIVEDDQVQRELLKKQLTNSEFSPTFTQNGLEALDVYRSEFFPIIITDIFMPEMDGKEFIKKIKTLGKTSRLVVQTSMNDPEGIIGVMHQQVFDYLIKPVQTETLISSLRKAKESFEIEFTRRMLELERENKALVLAQARKIVDATLLTSKSKFEKNLFKNLQESFSQGSGFGNLLSLISIASSQPKDENMNTIINEELMNLLLNNAQSCQQALIVFSEIEKIISSEMKLESVNQSRLKAILKDGIMAVQRELKLRNHSAILAEPVIESNKNSALIDIAYFEKAFSELLINAFKFSEAGSSILILPEFKKGKFILAILNIPEKNDSASQGIPDEYSKLIFEPFFRLSKTVKEEYDTLEFGLGLTLVEKIIEKLNGRISVFNVKNYLDQSERNEVLVNFEIELPAFIE